jgi:amino acid transporter
MNYWVPDTKVNNAVWITVALVIIVILNCFPASVYGETEFLFSSIKIITIVGLISACSSRGMLPGRLPSLRSLTPVCGIAINCGAGEHGYIGFKYWKDPGPFTDPDKPYLGLSGATGRFLGFWAVLTQAAFS